MNSNTTSNQSNLLPPDVKPEDFINKDILDLIGAQNLREDEKGKLYNKMIDSIQARVLTRIYQQLSGEDKQEWDNLLKADNQPDIANFLQQKNIELEKIFTEEALSYKQELVQSTQNLQGK